MTELVFSLVFLLAVAGLVLLARRPRRCPECLRRSLQQELCLQAHGLGSMAEFTCAGCGAEFVRYCGGALRPKYSPFDEPARVVGHPDGWTCRVVIERLNVEGVEPAWVRVVDLPTAHVPPEFRAKGSRFRLSGLYRTPPAGTLDNACRIEVSTGAFRPEPGGHREASA